MHVGQKEELNGRIKDSMGQRIGVKVNETQPTNFHDLTEFLSSLEWASPGSSNRLISESNSTMMWSRAIVSANGRPVKEKILSEWHLLDADTGNR